MMMEYGFFGELNADEMEAMYEDLEAMTICEDDEDFGTVQYIWNGHRG